MAYANMAKEWAKGKKNVSLTVIDWEGILENGVEIKDVAITACGDFGVWSNGTSGNVVNNLTMDNVHITDGNGEQDSSDNAFGAYISYTNNATLNNCSFNNQLPTTGTNSESTAVSCIVSETAIGSAAQVLGHR